MRRATGKPAPRASSRIERAFGRHSRSMSSTLQVLPRRVVPTRATVWEQEAHKPDRLCYFARLVLPGVSRRTPAPSILLLALASVPDQLWFYTQQHAHGTQQHGNDTHRSCALIKRAVSLDNPIILRLRGGSDCCPLSRSMEVPRCTSQSHSGSAALSKTLKINGLRRMVGVAGFEPATPTSRTWCATRLRYTPTGGRSYNPNL
jgi:hypothetical protein